MDVLEVARFSTLPEAELAVTLLREHGIDARLPDRETASTMPHLHFALGNLRVVAPAGQIADARAIMARARAGEFAAADDDDGDWSHAAVPGKIGELDDGEVHGVMGLVKPIGIGLLVTFLVATVAGALWDV